MLRTRTLIVTLAASFNLLLSCAAGRNHSNDSLTAPALAAKHAQAVSLLGSPLFAPALPPEQRQQRQLDLDKAQADYDRDPHNEDAIIWLGRRQAYLGQYQEAINTFSNGLAIHPDSFKLLRHRGHRYITIRKFDLALADLERAAGLIESVPDEIEPDGQPNKLNVPTSTSHTNIYYHLGLARYLLADYEGALDAYERCMEFSENDDMRAATAYWQYLTLRHLNREGDASLVLASISTAMDIIENASYHRLLLMFKGDLTPEEVFRPGADAQPADIDAATTGYGIGQWRLWQGQRDDAHNQFKQVIRATNWAAFGHIAAEAELARSASFQP